MNSGFSAPLQVLALLASRRGDPDRGPAIRMRSDDAERRLLMDGELVWIQGPRRQELGVVIVDDTLPRGGVILRDVVGSSPSEIIRVMKLDTDTPRGRDRNLA